MGKRSRTKARDHAVAEGEVGPRQPCPCGSGRRYKACHGSAAGAPTAFVSRPFEGLPSECDVVALRELVPAATAPLTLKDSDRTVQLCSLLPMAAPAMVRDSGEIWLGLQVQHQFGDPARDLGAVLVKALDADPGVVGLTDQPGDGPRLQDLVSGTALDVTVHDGFDYWIADVDDKDSMAGALDQANASAHPTARLASVEAAYWTDVGSKEHLRWVLPEPEDRAPRRAGPPACLGQGLDRRGVAVRRDVPRARAADTGVGPAGRDRRRGARGACRAVRVRPRRGPGRRRRPDHRGARRALGPGQPASDDPVTHLTQMGEGSGP